MTAFFAMIVATHVTMTWSPGWDIQNRPLNHHQSFVTFDQSQPSRSVTFTYQLQHAVPNTTHIAGIHLFWGEAGTSRIGLCLHRFGQFGASGCAFTCRQWTCRTYNSFELCKIRTDASGNGGCSAIVMGVAPKRYELELDVRDTGDPVSGVIYQSPGPYGTGTLSFTMP